VFWRNQKGLGLPNRSCQRGMHPMTEAEKLINTARHLRSPIAPETPHSSRTQDRTPRSADRAAPSSPSSGGDGWGLLRDGRTAVWARVDNTSTEAPRSAS